jgi:type II secretory pathway pseudopilin PulG
MYNVNMKNKTKKYIFIAKGNRKGFTLIESLVLVFIVAVAVMTFYRTYTLAMRYAIDTKHRTAAVAFATEQIEILRNTPYEDIELDPATNPPTGNVISGVAGSGLDYDELRNINDVPHRLLREVYYVDDAEDGTGSGDSEPQDYKKVIITVLWGNGIVDPSDESHRIFLSSFFVPPSGNESAVVNGALSVNVVNSEGMPVENASVGIKYTNGDNVSGYPNPIVTSSTGNVLFLNLAKASYKITITKSGSETIETMATTADFNPMYPYASILPGVITTMTMVMDVTPDAIFRVSDPFGDDVQGGIDMGFTGGRVLGLNIDDGTPVYVNTNLTATSTATSGEIICDDVSGYTPSIGTYMFQLDNTGYVFWKERDADVCASYDTCNVCVEDPAVMRDASNNTAEVTSGTFNSDLIIIDKTVDGILFKVTDDVTHGPFEGVTVRLENSGLSYDYTRTTDQYGMVYFPVKNVASGDEGTACDIVPLENGEEYSVTITTDGYVTQTQSVTVTGLEEVNVTMILS